MTKNFTMGSAKASALFITSALIFVPAGSCLAQVAATADADQTTGVEPAAADDADILVTGRRFLVASSVSSTKLDQSILDTPNALTVIDEKAFHDLGLNTYVDALKLIPGVTYAGSFGSIPLVISRGFALGDNSYRINGSSVGINRPIDNVAVERLEFVRGGAGTTFGEGGPGGFLNLITKMPPKELAVDLEAQAGSFDFLRAQGTVGGPLNASGSIRGIFGASIERGDSFSKFESAKKHAVYGALAVDLGGGIVWTTTAYTNHIRRDQYNNGWPALVTRDSDGNVLNAEFPSFLPIDSNFAQPWAGEKVDLSYVTSDLTVPIGSRFTVSVLGGYTASKILQVISDLCCEISPDGVTSINSLYTRVNYRTINAEIRLKGDIDVGTTRTQVIATGEYRNNRQIQRFSDYNTLDDQLDLNNPRYYIPDPFAGLSEDQFVTYTPIAKVNVYSGSLLAFSKVTSRLSLTLGARYDRFNPGVKAYVDNGKTLISDSSFPNDNWSFRGAATYAIGEGGRLYYSYGQTFEINGAKQCDGTVLPPETGRIHEVGYKQELLGRALLVSASAYHIRTKNNSIRSTFAECPTVPDGVSKPGEGQKSEGFEFEAVGRLTRNWNIIFGYAYTDARTPEDGLNLRTASVAPHQASLFTVYDFDRGPLRGFGLGGGFTYLASRDGTNTASGGAAGQRVRFGQEFRADLSAYYRITRQFSLQLNVKNVFDTKSPNSPFVTTEYQNAWLAPRTVLATLDWSL